jgi:hypothetical protein
MKGDIKRFAPQGRGAREERESSKRIRTAVHKGGVHSLRLLARQKAQLLGVLPSDRSFAVATQKGVE